MGRKKRSEKLGEKAVAVKPALVAVAPKVAERIIHCLCPLCGRTIPQDRAIKIDNITIDRVGYFASIDWDENKPFGVAYSVGGRGSFRDWEHIGPEQAPELFEALKGRFLQALEEWLNKKWIAPEEIKLLLEKQEVLE